jgi:hypothetical protein
MSAFTPLVVDVMVTVLRPPLVVAVICAGV